MMIEILGVEPAGCALRVWLICPYCGRPGFVIVGLKNSARYNAIKLLKVLHDKWHYCCDFTPEGRKRAIELKKAFDEEVEKIVAGLAARF